MPRQWTGRARVSRGGRGASNARSRMPVGCLPVVARPCAANEGRAQGRSAAHVRSAWPPPRGRRGVTAGGAPPSAPNEMAAPDRDEARRPAGWESGQLGRPMRPPASGRARRRRALRFYPASILSLTASAHSPRSLHPLIAFAYRLRSLRPLIEPADRARSPRPLGEPASSARCSPRTRNAPAFPFSARCASRPACRLHETNRASHPASEMRCAFAASIDVDQRAARIDRRQSSGERREAACSANAERSRTYGA